MSAVCASCPLVRKLDEANFRAERAERNEALMRDELAVSRRELARHHRTLFEKEGR